MQKKIGILTFHFKDNFGAVLQCYAMQEFLTSKGYRVEVINFKPGDFRTLGSIVKQQLKFLIKNYKLLNIVSYYNLIRSLVIQTKKFRAFRGNFLKSSKHYNSNNFDHDLNDYDIIITGSDQIWNSINSYSKAYFLKPFLDYSGKKIAYAACRGVKSILQNEVNYLKDAFENYDWIGVRDNQTKEFVEKISDASADVVCDPSMLIDYSGFLSDKRVIEGKYVLVYVLGKEIEGGHLNVINKIKEQYGNLKVVACYLTNKNPNYFTFADEHVYDASPIEWINLINQSEFFYTDSFHGALFAIKFKKLFLAFYSDKIRSSRLIDISNRFKIKNNIISSYNDGLNKKSFQQSEISYNKGNIISDFVSVSKEKLILQMEK
jgi:hypothetical protein